MEDRQQWLSMAAVVLVIVGLGFFLYRQSRQPTPIQVTTSEDQIQQKADQVLEQMKTQLPLNATRSNMKDITGGDAVGVATRIEENGSTAQSFMAALPEPAMGEFYEGYAVKEAVGNQPMEYLYIGRLEEVKGGWKLEKDLTTSLSDYKKVVISREKTNDRKPETVVLEGSF